jgi:peroxin-2
VWHAFTEFLLFVLPLIGINKWRRWLSKTWRKTKEIINTGPEGEKSASGEYGFLPERTCAICYQDQNDSATTETEILAAAASSGVIGSAQTDVTNPYETIPCGCIYCFVCLATRLEREEGEGWTCLRCGEHVKECKPWSGDVLEPATPVFRSTSTKTVAFTDDVTGGVLEEQVPPREHLEPEETSAENSAEDFDEGFDEASDIVDDGSDFGSDIGSDAGD